MSEYTVIGLYRASDDEFLVAGVAEGSVVMVDDGPEVGSDGDWQRMAHLVEAGSPDHAERVAREIVELE